MRSRRIRRACARCSPTFMSIDARRARDIGDHRGGHPSRRARDDGSGRRSAPSRHRSTPPAIRPTPTRCSSSSSMDSSAGLERDVRLVAAASAVAAGARTVRDRARTRRSARDSGRDARRRSARWAASRRISSCRTPSFRARSCPRCCARSRRSRRGWQIQVCNVFHAGDGNLHPNIGYDSRNADESRARAAWRCATSCSACIDAGGTITGEHGIGLDKLEYMPLIFSPESLAAQCALRDAFDPERRANPGKVVPVHSCREWMRRVSTARGTGARATSDVASRATRARRGISAAPLRIVGQRHTGSTPAAPCATRRAALARRRRRNRRIRPGRSHAHGARRHDARRASRA